MLHLEVAKDLLSREKLRSTPVRTAVLEVFLGSPHAVSMQQIESTIGEHDRITLYRTMKTFQEKGLIHQIALPNEEAKYALCAADCSSEQHQHDHVHFKCTECQEVYCKEVPHLPQIQIKGFRVDSVEVCVSGVCLACSKL